MQDGGRRVVLYARVSTQEQEKEGFSIPAQMKLLRAYADAQGMTVAAEHVDVETARKTGRTEFEAMLRYIRKHPSSGTILVEKTDRLYRNIKDWVTLDDVGVEIHLVKEGVVLSRDSRSSEKFMHGIKVLMAKNYIDNLSEEARKGMQEKAQQGLWPSLAPLGYLNGRSAEGRKIIDVDPENGPIVARLFERCSTGAYTLRELRDSAREAGLRYRRSGKPVGISTIHYILRNRIYSGQFEWNGQLCHGHHMPLVSPETWETVQSVLDSRSLSNVRADPREFTFTGLITCGHCGCAMTAEIKKGRYIYYHCTGHRGKCDEPYVRQEVIEGQFEASLRRLHLDPEIFDLVRRALKESHGDEKRDREQAIARLRSEADRLQQRIDTLYVDRLDGRVTLDFHDRMARVWREERARCLRDMEALSGANDGFVDDGIALLDFARSMHMGFARRPLAEKRTALKLLVSNSSWAGGNLSVGFKQPFAMLEQITPETMDGGMRNQGDSAAVSKLVTPTGGVDLFERLVISKA
jgi:DNA invertase Pin-like site-specific DNA recombinase